MRLQDRVVLITGGSRGVGAACAKACARAGAKVAVAARTVEPHPKLTGTLGDVVGAIESLGGEAIAIPTDVRDEDQICRMVARTVERFGRLDALVNNAGAIYLAPLADWPAKRYDLVMAVNVRAAFLACREAIPHLRDRGGHIVNLSPPIHPKGVVGKAPYMVSKIGMTLLAQAIDAEEPTIAACSLWPVTMIETAATVNFGLGSPRDWRTPDILADAMVALLARDPGECSFRAWYDEEVLRAEGVRDFSVYRCDPAHEPPPQCARFVDPDYTSSR